MYYKLVIEMPKKRLEALKSLLKKIETQAVNKNISDEVILGLRLAPDMFPLIKQVQIATDNAKGAAARLAGREIEKYDDSEITLTDVYARIDKTVALLETYKESDFESIPHKKIELSYFKDMHFTGEGYLFEYYIPNFLFHITTAYSILRANGFEIGKVDFMGGLPLIKNS